jgi:hypothetical protein
MAFDGSGNINLGLNNNRITLLMRQHESRSTNATRKETMR